jgi:site-specific recombinase XerC
VTKECVILEKNIVHISELVSKTGRARNVEIPENAREWLRIDGDFASVRKLKKGEAKLRGILNLRERFDRVRRQAGLFKHWPNRAMRHSSATYLYALTEDEKHVAKNHGHDVNIMLTHYKASKTPAGQIVTKELAQEYFGIKPPCHLRILENVA